MTSEDAKKTILLVGSSNSVYHKAFVLEDEPDLSIIKIDNGFDALKHILTQSLPDLVVMDLLSEKINGLHYCYIVNKLLEIKQLKVIIFSEHSHRNNIIKGIQSGAVDYIIDPCSDVLFKDRVKYHLFETPYGKLPAGEVESEKTLSWKFLTTKTEGDFEFLYLEKRLKDGKSEVKKLSRNLVKKDFSYISLGTPNQDEFKLATSVAKGDSARFVFNQSAPKSSIEMNYQDKAKAPDVDFNRKKLDIFTATTESTSKLEETIAKREDTGTDRILSYEDLSKIAKGNHNLKTLLEVDKKISTSKNKRESMFAIVDEISSFIDCVRASVIVPTEDLISGFVLVASDNRGIDNLKIDLKKYPEIIKCLNTGELVFIENVNKSEILNPVLNTLKHLEFNSIVVVPIWHNRKIIAVLSIRGKAGAEAIKYEDLALCQLLANSTARTVASNLFLQKIMQKFSPGLKA